MGEHEEAQVVTTIMESLGRRGPLLLPRRALLLCPSALTPSLADLGFGLFILQGHGGGGILGLNLEPGGELDLAPRLYGNGRAADAATLTQQGGSGRRSWSALHVTPRHALLAAGYS